MSSLANHTITLPSRGALYDGKVPDGKIEIRRLSARDQTMLFGSGSIDDRISKLITHTAVLPANLKAADLLTVDRMAILLAIRTFSFGADYEFAYKCQACGSSQKAVINVNRDLNEVKTEPMEEPFDIKLPDCDKTVSVRFLRGADEEAVAKTTKRLALQSVDAGDTSTIARLARLIVKVDGEEHDLIVREKFVGDMTARDANTIEDEIAAREPGIDLTVHPECTKCEHVNDMRMPFDRDFFRPTALRARPL